MTQQHKRFSTKLKYLPVVNLRNFSTFLILVYAVENYFSNFCQGFNFEKLVYPILHSYVELQCDRVFSESYKAVSLVDVTKFPCESLEF